MSIINRTGDERSEVAGRQGVRPCDFLVMDGTGSAKRI